MLKKIHLLLLLAIISCYIGIAKSEVISRLERYDKECDAGNTDGCRKFVAITENICDGGLFIACETLGMKYYKGEDVKQDYIKAAELFQMGCDFGGDGACVILGGMYLEGQGLKQSYSKALELYQKSCDGYNREINGVACLSLGLMYEYGKGVRKNIQKARELYGKACDLKDQDGCENYARLSK